MRSLVAVTISLALLACGSEDSPAASGTGGVGGATASGGEGGSDGGATGGGGAPSGSGGSGEGGGGIAACPESMTCVESFPFHDEGDTTTDGQNVLSVYGCKPEADESGPELHYRVTVPAPGQLTATITDGDGVDIDVHVLTSIKNGTCIARDDITVTTAVLPPYVYVTADTYVSAGVPQAGPFSIDIDFTAD